MARITRSRSCPAAIDRRAAVNAAELVAVALGELPARRAKPHSIGLAGFESTHGVIALAELRSRLFRQPIKCHVEAEISEFKGTLYAIVWLHRDFEEGMMEPQKWHVTLLRGRIKNNKFRDTIKNNRLNMRFQDVFEALVHDSPWNLWFARPPWAKSWNFGFYNKEAYIFEILRMTAKQLIYPNVVLQPDRKLHVSWV